MPMETLERLGIKHKGLFIFGIFLLLTGIATYSYYYEPPLTIYRVYPYQDIGMVLVLAGIIFVAMGFFYSPRKRQIEQG